MIRLREGTQTIKAAMYFYGEFQRVIAKAKGHFVNTGVKNQSVKDKLAYLRS